MNIGILGGSFDPPHVGHVLLASYALSVCELDRVLVAPVFQHALDKTLTPFAVRMRLCELAFAPLPQVEVSDIERDLGGTSRTLRLIDALAARHPTARFRLIVGADILLEKQRWQAFDQIVVKAPLFAVARAGVACDELPRDAPVLPEVSSTHIREGLARGDDVSSWLPHAVLAQIRAEGLYGASP